MEIPRSFWARRKIQRLILEWDKTGVSAVLLKWYKIAQKLPTHQCWCQASSSAAKSMKKTQTTPKASRTSTPTRSEMVTIFLLLKHDQKRVKTAPLLPWTTQSRHRANQRLCRERNSTNCKSGALSPSRKSKAWMSFHKCWAKVKSALRAKR